MRGERVERFRFHQLGCTDCPVRSRCLPSGLGADDLTNLTSIIRHGLVFEVGESVHRQSDRMQALAVTRVGSVKTSIVTQEGREQIIGFHLPGELFGFGGVANGRHDATATALERSIVCAIPYERLIAMTARIPALQRGLLGMIAMNSAADHHALFLLGQETAEQRLASLLLSLSRRFADRGGCATRFRLAMSRYDLANYLGLSLGTVSRLFTTFQTQGLLRIYKRYFVESLDVAGLRSLTIGDGEILRARTPANS